MIKPLLRSIGRYLRSILVRPGAVDLASHQLKDGLELRSPGQDENTSIIVRGDFRSSVEAGNLFVALTEALNADEKDHAGAFQGVLEIPGMSGRKYRRLANRMISLAAAPRYLEIGSWAGSTACAAIHGNRVAITCIDNWSGWGGPKEEFFRNVEANSGPGVDFSFIEADFRKVDFSAIGPFDVYLFDGPHSEKDQYDGIRLAQPALADTFVLIVDDWNWEQVRLGTLRGIADEKLRIYLSVEIRTSRDNRHALKERERSDWHNGYFICACRKDPQP